MFKRTIERLKPSRHIRRVSRPTSLFILVLLITLLCSFGVSAAVWDGQGVGSGATGAGSNYTGFALPRAGVGDIVGYRFSIYDGNGTKHGYSIDINFRSYRSSYRVAAEGKQSHIDLYAAYRTNPAIKLAGFAIESTGNGYLYEESWSASDIAGHDANPAAFMDNYLDPDKADEIGRRAGVNLGALPKHYIICEPLFSSTLQDEHYVMTMAEHAVYQSTQCGWTGHTGSSTPGTYAYNVMRFTSAVWGRYMYATGSYPKLGTLAVPASAIKDDRSGTPSILFGTATSYNTAENVLIYQVGMAVYTDIISTYTIKYDGNGATSGSVPDQTMAFDKPGPLNTGDLKKQYTITYNGNGGTPATGSAIASAPFKGWQDHNSITIDGVTYPWYAFNAPFYSNYYGDLYSAFGYNKVSLINHWLGATVNSAESRSSSEYFNVKYYMGIHDDLINAFGTNTTSYLDHWIDFGYNEGRTGTSSVDTSDKDVYPAGATVENLTNVNNGTVTLTAKWGDATVVLCTATRAGYTFTGWNTMPDGSGTAYAAGDTYVATGNVTLYAQWSSNSTITFKYYSNYANTLNGNTINSSQQVHVVDWTVGPDSAFPQTHWDYTSGAYTLYKDRWNATGYWGTEPEGGILVHENESFTDYAAICEKYGIDINTPNTTINLYAQWDCDLRPYLIPIDPNAAYRENTDVITSYWLVNPTNNDYTTDNEILVRIKVYDTHSGNLITELTKTTVVPAGETQLVYFKWSVPYLEDFNDIKIIADLNLPKYDYWEGSVSKNYDYGLWNTNYTPDTDYEDKQPAGWTRPGSVADAKGNATWGLWEYSNGAFKYQEYGITAAGGQLVLTPQSKTAYKEIYLWYMKAGYGFTAEATTAKIGKHSGTAYLMPGIDAYTGAQYAYMYYPEFQYQIGATTIDTMENVDGKWQLFEFLDYGRVHFTPIWYPDGVYDAVMVQSDIWTPMGMLTTQKVASVVIEGDLYDDWYIQGT